MSEINFACSLANPTIRTAIRTHAAEIPWKSELARKIVDFFLNDQNQIGGVIPDAHVRAFLSNHCMEDEIESIIIKTNDYVSSGDNIGGILGPFTDFYTNKMVTQILEDGKGNASDIVTRIKSIATVQSDLTPIDVLGDLDVDYVIQQELGGSEPLPTQFDFVRRATPYQGYLKGQVAQVVAAPGTGKSLFLANEVDLHHVTECNEVSFSSSSRHSYRFISQK